MISELEFSKAKYLTSAADLDQLPKDEGWEIAFIGRSNAGKSSALNMITGIKGLAITSNTPGRTQMINFFALDEQHRLVDLPGYGYAKVPRVVKERWEQNIDEYLKIRRCLRGLVLVMDIRHPLKETDKQLIDWTVQCEVPIHILLTKADKLSTQAAKKVLREVEEELKMYGTEDGMSLQLFSSLEKTGLDDARAILTEWLK